MNDIIKIMATGETPIYNLPYPLPTDPVDVAGDIQELAGRIEQILPELTTPNTKIPVVNNTLASIAIGDPLFISGYDSLTGFPEVTKSRADTVSTMPAIGVAASVIDPGNEGQLVVIGVVDAVLDTSSYSSGDVLYVGETGGLTDVQPVYPNYSQQIAVVLEVDATDGTIAALSSGNSGTPTWGQLKYNS